MGRNTNFYYSFLVLTPARRRAIIAVWDFCRAVDDTVDDQAEVEAEAAVAAGASAEAGRGASSVPASPGAASPVAVLARLDAWRREIAACFTPGVVPETPQGRGLQPYARMFRLPRRPFEDLIEGVSLDIGHRRYRTFNELYQYCYKVASTVGLICVEIFGCREAASRDYAVDLGIALQLTNILRDVKGDLERGRLYIPLDDLAQFHCSEELLRTSPRHPAVVALLRHQARRARDYHQRAARALPQDDARRLVAAEIMGAIYLAILDEIERRDFDVFSEVIGIPNRQRASIAFRTWLRTMTGRRQAPDPIRHA